MFIDMKKYTKYIFAFVDIILICLCYIGSLLFLNGNTNIDTVILIQVIISIIIFEVLFVLFKFYKDMIRYQSVSDYSHYMICSLVYINVISVINLFTGNFHLFFKTNILAGIFSVGLIVLYRLVIRTLLNKMEFEKNKKNNVKVFNLLIIGAGMSGREIVLTIKNKLSYRYNIVGLIDDDLYKHEHKILDINVIGTRFDIPLIVEKYDVDLIFFAINNIDSINRKDILKICQSTNVKTKVLPTIEEIIDKHGALNSLREIEIEDLLGRDSIEFDDKNVKALIKDKVVLVTGGGGSIGSELCRQISIYKPKQLIIFDIYENNLYDIQMELQRVYPKLDLIAIVGSVRDRLRLDNVFDKYRPDIVFHAAAHKHVPLMENNPLEAIKNNIFGTYNVAYCADCFGVKKFILISTDKAVNPTNIMGASKRFCEMIIQSLNKKSKTDYAAVRFGNVLGSNGSVIPLFKKQISNGGPVTVTHKDITRFFMTIPEAVQLILQAVTYAEGGEIFVLDMGKPVKIYDLAVDLIKLMGYEPNVDMMIEVTGLRPGEKLYEELLMSEEGLISTKYNKIFISKSLFIDDRKLEKYLKALKKMEYDKGYDESKIISLMKKAVPTYRDNKIVNKNKKEYDNNEK